MLHQCGYTTCWQSTVNGFPWKLLFDIVTHFLLQLVRTDDVLHYNSFDPIEFGAAAPIIAPLSIIHWTSLHFIYTNFQIYFNQTKSNSKGILSLWMIQICYSQFFLSIHWATQSDQQTGVFKSFHFQLPNHYAWQTLASNCTYPRSLFSKHSNRQQQRTIAKHTTIQFHNKRTRHCPAMKKTWQKLNKNNKQI
jgi:hypothetical protein